MANVVIIGILVIVILLGVRQSIQHFKGEGGCCGGGGEIRIKKKKLRNVIGTKIATVEGMTCDHCKTRVENRLNALDGISAKVSLKKKTAVIRMEKEIRDDEIIEAVEKAGYTVSNICSGLKNKNIT